MRRSPLDAAHRALGAKMTEFGGWEMPLAYPAGTIAEHTACRTAAVVFDVSHLGTVRVTGGDAFDRLQAAFTNDLRRIGPGRAQYTHLLDADDGSVLDDIIVWWVDDERFDVMPNASNTSRVREALGVGADADVTGGARRCSPSRDPQHASGWRPCRPRPPRSSGSRSRAVAWHGVDLVVAGTGYTGEDGVEIAVPADAAPAMWDAVVAAGVEPAGLGARDTLRLEAGLPLHGHELGPGITPLQAGLGWVVRWDKGDFRGRAAVAAEKEAGVRRRLRGIATEGRRPPRAGYRVRSPAGEVHERRVLARPRPRHRAGVPATRGRRRRRRRGRSPRGSGPTGSRRASPVRRAGD